MLKRLVHGRQMLHALVGRENAQKVAGVLVLVPKLLGHVATVWSLEKKKQKKKQKQKKKKKEKKKEREGEEEEEREGEEEEGGGGSR